VRSALFPFVTPASILLLAGVGCHRAPSGGASAENAAASVAPAWSATQRYEYGVHLVTSANSKSLGAGDYKFDLTAVLQIVPLQVSGSIVELALGLRDPTLVVGSGQSSPELAAELQVPYAFTLDHGALVSSRVAKPVSPLALATLRSLSSAFEFAAPPAGQARWSAKEYDGTGQYEAAYQLDAGANLISKHKARYLDTLLSGKVDAANRLKILPKMIGSEGSVTVARGTFAGATMDDRIETDLLIGDVLDVHNHLELTLRKSETASDAERAASVSALSSAIGFAAGSAFATEPAGDAFIAARSGGRDFAEVVSELETLAKDPKNQQLWGAENDQDVPDAEQQARKERLKNKVGAFSSLAALLHDSKNVPLAVAKVRSGSPAAAQLLDGLAVAGTDEAQAALVTIVSDATLPPKVRLDAATSLIRVKLLTTDSVAKLESWFADPLLKEHAVFGLGSAARRLREAGQEARSREISDRIVHLLTSAKDDADRVRCLRGVANSAYSGAIPAVEPLLTAKEFSVRSAAVEALRLMQDPRVDPLVTQRMLKDDDARVRTTAIRVAARRGMNATLTAALSQVALNDADVVARQSAVVLLGTWAATDKSLRATLEQVKAKEQRPEVRDLAQAALDKT